MISRKEVLKGDTIRFKMYEKLRIMGNSCSRSPMRKKSLQNSCRGIKVVERM